MRRPARGRIARGDRDLAGRQQRPELVVGVASAELAEVLPAPPQVEITEKQALDRLGHLGGRDAVADRPGRGLVLPDGAPTQK